jgi:CRP/FNR family transcriptional regulator
MRTTTRKTRGGVGQGIDIPVTPHTAAKGGLRAQLQTACSACNLHELCMPGGLDVEEHRRARHAGGLAGSDQAREGAFQGRRSPSMRCTPCGSGFFKTRCDRQDGLRDQVTGFQMPGELLGLDGIATEPAHRAMRSRWKDSDVCRHPLCPVSSGLSLEVPCCCTHQFHKVMSREIVREHGVMLLLGTMRAEERRGRLSCSTWPQRFTAAAGTRTPSSSSA